MNKALWIARLLYNRGPLTRDEILEAWSEEDYNHKPMALSTFYDNIWFMEVRFGLHAKKIGNKYYLVEEDYVNDPVVRKMLSFEKNANELETIWVDLLIDAIEQLHPLRMDYAPLDKPAYESMFSPYCVRKIKNHCYVVGYSSRHKEVRNFSVDRITQLVMMPQRFKIASDFSADRYFLYSFGAFGGVDVQPERIVLATNEHMAAYLKSRPLHASQKLLEKSADGTTLFELTLAPTPDFLGEMMVLAPEAMVVEPESVRNTLRVKLKEAAEVYK
jgi:predicted DNA-binding transcriptional regulator YafY